jgi:hypothetical protein
MEQLTNSWPMVAGTRVDVSRFLAACERMHGCSDHSCTISYSR